MIEIDIQKIANEAGQNISQKLPEKLGNILGKLQPGASHEELMTAVYIAAVEVSGTVTGNMLMAYHEELSTQLEELFAAKNQ